LTVYRKTVATLMDAAGLSARQAADQLGHAKVSMTQDNYFARKVARAGAVEVLAFSPTTLSRADSWGKRRGGSCRLFAIQPLS
jgi:hypothetical protein